MIVGTTEAGEAEGEVARVYESDLREMGYVMTHTKALAVDPEAYFGFQQIMRATIGTLGLRRFELVTLAAARGTRSRHCRLAHGAKMLLKDVVDADQLERIALDYADAGLDDAEVEMMRYAERVATDPLGMTDADSLALREAGFSDREIVDITLAAAARVYLGVALQALAVDVDETSALSAELKAALVAGL